MSGQGRGACVRMRKSRESAHCCCLVNSSVPKAAASRPRSSGAKSKGFRLVIELHAADRSPPEGDAPAGTQLWRTYFASDLKVCIRPCACAAAHPARTFERSGAAAFIGSLHAGVDRRLNTTIAHYCNVTRAEDVVYRWC